MKGVDTVSKLTLTQELFEASKILAPALCRGRSSLVFDGYGIRKWLTVRFSMHSGKKHRVRLITEIEFEKTVHEFTLSEYMNLEWTEVKELLSDLDGERS